MKRFVLISIALLVCISLFSYQLPDMVVRHLAKQNPGSFKFRKVISSVNEAKSLLQSFGVAPIGAAGVFVSAMIIYPKNKVLGTKLFTLVLSKKYLKRTNSQPNVDGYTLNSTALKYINKLNSINYLGRMYVQGTVAENLYKLPNSYPRSVYFSKAKYGGLHTIVLFASLTKNAKKVQANKPRAITVYQVANGQFKVIDFANMFNSPTN